MNLGENIYHYRSQKNMSQGDLADSLEVSRQSVSKWENNSAVPELDKLMRMAQIFGITIDELVTGEEAEQPAPPPPAPPAPTEAPGSSAQKIIGIIFLVCGILLSLVCFILSIIKENQYGEDMLMAFMLVGLPMIAIGIVCLLVKKHTLLVCGWMIYLPLWMMVFILNARTTSLFPMTWYSLLAFFTLGYGVTLSIGTLVQLWTGKIQTSLVMKILITILIGILLLIPFLLSMPPQVEELYPVT